MVCYYTIARFIPNVLRNEPRNIGLLLYNENNGLYLPKFIGLTSHKLGASVNNSDKQILLEYFKYFNSLRPSSKDDLIDKTDIKEGKVQFSEMQAVITESPETEFEYLYHTFIYEKIIERRKRLKTYIKNELKGLKLLGSKKFKQDVIMSPPKSDLTYTVDFAFENKRLHLIEAVDLVNGNKKDSYETAFKFNELRKGRKNKVDTISVIKAPANDPKTKEYVDVLNETSTVYNFTTGEKDDFLDRMKKIVQHHN